MCRDIDDQKHAEDELRRSEERFRLLAEAIPEMVWMATPHGDFVYFNQRWLDYTGFTLEEARGQGWIEAIHPDDRQSAVQAPGRRPSGTGTLSIFSSGYVEGQTGRIGGIRSEAFLSSRR